MRMTRTYIYYQEGKINSRRNNSVGLKEIERKTKYILTFVVIGDDTVRFD